MDNLWLFYACAGLAVVTSLLVVAQPNPVYSVLLLIGSFVALAGLYVLLDAPFVAVIQIIVYAGAIMVLFLFVVMLLNAPKEDAEEAGMMPSGATRAIGALLAVTLMAELVWAVSRSRAVSGMQGRARTWSVGEIGEILFREYAFAFEVTSVLILVAMVGAIALAGRQTPNPESPIPNPQSLAPNPQSRIPSPQSGVENG